MIHGQDWSSYQSATPSTAGLSFVFVKATEGLSYVNPKAGGQAAHGRAAGLTVGWYHYPHIANSPGSEADHFLAHADVRPGDLIALDWEWYGQKVSDAAARAYKKAWLAHVQARLPHHRVGLYCDRNVWTRVDTDSDCGDFLWIADPGAPAGHPRVQHPWTFHQYSTAGGIDHDVAHFADTAALRAWAAGNAPTKTTTTPTKPPAAKEDDMQATDQLPVPDWMQQQWKNDQGLADGRMQVETALVSGYGHARATHDSIAAILAQLGALTALVTNLASGGGLTAEQATAAAAAGARAALAELGHTLTDTTPTT